MQTQQKKVQEFLDGLKVGDKVVTTGGIYGPITRSATSPCSSRLPTRSAIEVAASGHRRLSGAGAGRAGPGTRLTQARHDEPALEDSYHDRRRRRRLLRGRRLSDPRARYGAAGARLADDKQLKLGLDLKGGVHLVLRVQTDDALRIETETAREQLREELRDGGRDVGVTVNARRRRRTFRSKACRRTGREFRAARPTEIEHELRPRVRRRRHLHASR